MVRTIDQTTAVLDAATLRRALAIVAPAMSTDKTRPILAGIRLTVDGETITALATDSYVLAVHREDYANECAVLSVTIPADTVKAMIKVKVGGRVALVLGDTFTATYEDGSVLAAAVSDASYPDVAGLMATEWNGTAVAGDRVTFNPLVAMATLAAVGKAGGFDQCEAVNSSADRATTWVLSNQRGQTDGLTMVLTMPVRNPNPAEYVTL